MPTKHIILTHVGSDIPEYTKYCVKQLQYSNPDYNITMLCDNTEFNRNFCKENNIDIYETFWLEQDALLQEFRRVSWFKAWGKPPTVYPSPENFVQGTSERLFWLNAIINKHDLKDVWHFENDNLVYGNLSDIEDETGPNVNLCYMNEKHVVWNFVFIPNKEKINSAIEWYLENLSKGNEWLCKTYGLEMVHEMTVFSQYPHFDFFPSIPGDYGNILVDPASYGQFIAGTNNGHPPGFRDTVNHNIGKCFGSKWENVIMNNERPFVVHKNDIYELANLHMHNKTKMSDFIRL